MKSLSKLLVISVALLGLGLTTVSLDAQAACRCGKRVVVVKHYYRHNFVRYYNPNAGILTQWNCCNPCPCPRPCCGGGILSSLF